MTGIAIGSDPSPLPTLLRETVPVDVSFFERPTVDVARDLLGCILLHGETAGMIVETEAYLGLDDLAAHASHGKTERTKVLFGPAGRAYVYFSYGMHECLNIVADREGTPGCVLIRALEPLTGIEAMTVRRGMRPLRELCNGPGKLCQAMGIEMSDYGTDLESTLVWLEDDGYLVSYVLDEADGRSEVSVLDARDVEAGPLARVKLPVRVPIGFHATWVPGERLPA